MNIVRSSARVYSTAEHVPIQIQSNTKPGCRNKGQIYFQTDNSQTFPIPTNLHRLAFNPRAQLNRFGNQLYKAQQFTKLKRNCHVFTKEPQQTVLKIIISFQGSQYNSEEEKIVAHFGGLWMIVPQSATCVTKF